MSASACLRRQCQAGRLNRARVLRRFLFVFGCFCVVPSIVGVFLGLIQRGRLQKEPSYRSEPLPLLPGQAVLRMQRLRSTFEAGQGWVL